MNSKATSPNLHNPDIPVYGVVADRASLHAVLENIRHHRLTLVSAPPGYGKTTAVAQFVHDTDLLTAWHGLQERERDLPALFWHSLQALEFAAPGISVAAESVTGADECAAYIADYLRDHLSEHIIYVLDDLHYLASAPQAERWLRELVRLIPPTCHLVLISRALPDLPLAELIARGDVFAIGQEQLKFTAEDASQLANKVGSDLPDGVLKARVRQLEGWPVGVAMSLRPLPEDIEIGSLRGSGGPEGLFEALANGILRSLSPMLSDFLLAASTFARVTPEVCTDVLGMPQSTLMMIDIVRRNLFVSQVSGGVMMHRLFRNFLQRRLSEADPERYVSLHARAAEWLRQRNQDDEAFHHYVAAGCIDEALEIVQRTHHAYYQQGNMETLLGWRTALGKHAERIPHFLHTCALILTDRYLYTDAIAELDLAEAGFAAMDEPGWVAEARLQRAMIHIWRAEYAEARALAEPVSVNTLLNEAAVGRARHLMALVEMAIGNLDTAIDHLEAILPFFERSNASYYVSAVLQDLAIAYARSGSMASASHFLQRLVSIRRTLGQTNALALALNNLGYHYHEMGDYELALSTLEEGLHIVSQSQNQRAESYIRWSIGDLQRDLGNTDAALRLYEGAYELSAGTEPVLQQSVALSMAALYRWRGDMRLAQWLVRDVNDTIRKLDASDASINRLARAHQLMIDLISGDTKKAAAQLGAMWEEVSEHPFSAELMQIAMFAAAAALRVGQQARATTLLERCAKACEIGVGRNIAAIEIFNSGELAECVQRSPQLKPLADALDRLRAARTASAGPERAEGQVANDATFGLRVYALGDETIERDGVTVSTHEWRSSRAKEFFLYLLFEGASSREKLSLIFWPDSSSSKVRSNFHTTLYRARRALGENVILFENDIYRINPGVSIWCDALVFRRYVQEAKMLPYLDARTDDLYRKAIALYRGEFLPGLDTEWTMAHREALYEMHISALIGSGHCARARGEFNDAIIQFKQALKIDPYREEAYRATFTCYAGMGELNSVLKQYNVMSAMFQTELGIKPSLETVRHVQQLTQRIS
ncbi:MAG: hypothetical protein DWB44_16230 [Chloroflexi bacterium]|nr:hypothetical protein [Chloroflexota bacterium]MDL1917341.1 tetratricopeptide repeat protein [Anaerolineae bacterium CFX4]MEB2367482.1 BTAD domain-containing putative transcriptional regulator [Chloroflexota bacterium]GIK27263.1 MAG: hypothetical protein BroJett007_04010 [Chloroflexota bacterium]